MKHLNPEIFQVGDVCTTTDFYPFSCVTRARTWGGVPRPHLGMGLGTHSFMICDRGDKIYYACEMRARLRMTELDRYDNGRYSVFPHITRVIRHPLFNGPDGQEYRDKINDFMIKMHSCGVKYGWEEIMKVAGINVPDDPDRFICSVWCRTCFDKVEIPVPWPKNKIVIPRDWQEWCGPSDINVYK